MGRGKDILYDEIVIIECCPHEISCPRVTLLVENMSDMRDRNVQHWAECPYGIELIISAALLASRDRLKCENLLLSPVTASFNDDERSPEDDDQPTSIIDVGSNDGN